MRQCPIVDYPRDRRVQQNLDGKRRYQLHNSTITAASRLMRPIAHLFLSILFILPSASCFMALRGDIPNAGMNGYRTRVVWTSKEVKESKNGN